MRKVAQRCSTGAGGRRAAGGKSASSGASCAASGANPCHQWHNNYQENNHRKTGGRGAELKVIPLAALAPKYVVPLTAAPVIFGHPRKEGITYSSSSESKQL
jgi:hypothetical protein